MENVIEKTKPYIITNLYPTIDLSTGLIKVLDFLPS